MDATPSNKNNTFCADALAREGHALPGPLPGRRISARTPARMGGRGQASQPAFFKKNTIIPTVGFEPTTTGLKGRRSTD